MSQHAAVSATGAADRLAIRELVAFVKLDGVWLFAERLLNGDWVAERLRS